MSVGLPGQALSPSQCVTQKNSIHISLSWEGFEITGLVSLRFKTVQSLDHVAKDIGPRMEEDEIGGACIEELKNGIKIQA
jgi:hypothetical protein